MAQLYAYLARTRRGAWETLDRTVMTALFIRAFVEGSQTEAAHAAASIVAAFQSLALAHRLEPIRAYWKIQTYQELVVQIEIGSGIAAMFIRLLERLGDGWTLLNELEAVWNPGPGATFLCPEVRWAHVELTDGIRELGKPGVMS